VSSGIIPPLLGHRVAANPNHLSVGARVSQGAYSATQLHPQHDQRAALCDDFHLARSVVIRSGRHAPVEGIRIQSKVILHSSPVDIAQALGAVSSFARVKLPLP
jgi:hypothetical protein